MTVSAYPEEVLFSSQEEADTRIVLHCLNISISLPEAGSIIVRSPDTDVLVLLAKYCKEIKNKILFDTGMGNKRRILCVNNIVQNKGEDVCSILPALHCFTGCDTTSTFVRREKIAPLKLVERNHQYIPHCGESRTQRKWILDEKRNSLVDENRINNQQNETQQKVYTQIKSFCQSNLFQTINNQLIYTCFSPEYSF